MKVKCEYCRNMVQVNGDRICPYCGSPLPQGPETSGPRPAGKAPAGGRARAHVLLALVFAGTAALLLLCMRFVTGDRGTQRAQISVSDAMAAVGSGSTDPGVYPVVVDYYLEQGQADSAYQAAWAMLELPGAGEYAGWCVERLQLFDRPDLAARLAMARDAKSGAEEEKLLPLVRDTALDRLLPQSPLRQAMELVLGRTAGSITLADLQRVTGLYIGRRDTLTGAQEIGVAFDGEGKELTFVTVEFSGQSAGLGTVCFGNLRWFALNDTNIRTREDLLLPELRELAILLRLDAEDLTKFSHLKKLRRLQVGGPALVSLEGLEQLPGLEELYLFDTGLADLSALAAQQGIVRLSLVDNDKLTGVASLARAGHLRSLTLSGESLTDLSALAGLSSLEELSVVDTAIRDAAFLSGLKGLKTLTLTGNDRLETVPQLGELPGLERLTLESDEMFAGREDVEKLAGLKALKLRVTKKLSFLSPLENLEELCIYSYQAGWDISGVAQFKHLRSLSFSSGNDFYDSYTASLEGLEALAGLELEELDLSGKPIYAPLDPVLEISTLRVLNLSGAFSQGTDYGKLANLTALERLDLGGYRDMVNTPPGPDEQFWSYKPGPAAVFVDWLGELTGLKWLCLAGCGVENADSLRALTGLQYLDLSDNNLSELDFLAQMDGLRYLDLSGNRIGDYSPAEGRSGLTLVR